MSETRMRPAQQGPLATGIPGVVGSRPAPQFGLGGFNDAAMALAYGGQTPQQAMDLYRQAEARFAAPQGMAPGSVAPPQAMPMAAPGTNPYAQYGGFNPAAYLAANPDVRSHYDRNTRRAHGEHFRNIETGRRQDVTNPYDFAFYHWTNYGQDAGRPLGL